MKEKYNNITLEKLSNIDNSSKLYLYSKLKNEIKFEDFLHNLNNFNSRQLLTKLRVSDHNLEIELGRYKFFLREHRLCKVC